MNIEDGEEAGDDDKALDEDDSAVAGDKLEEELDTDVEADREIELGVEETLLL